MKTQIEVKLKGKKITESYNKDRPIAYELEFEVPYDQNGIYYQLSGGTAPVFRTINQEVGESMVLGAKYMITIEPVTKEAVV